MKLYEKYELAKHKQLTFPLWAITDAKSMRKKSNRRLTEDGTVVWDMSKEHGRCADHIEMSGFYVSAVISYAKTKNNALKIRRHVVIPTVRTKPNITQSSFGVNFDASPDTICINKSKYKEVPVSSSIKGNLSISSDLGGKAIVTRTFYPSVNFAALIEKIEIKNTDPSVIDIDIVPKKIVKTFPDIIFDGGSACAYADVCMGDGAFIHSDCVSAGHSRLAAHEILTFYNVYYVIPKGCGFELPVAQEIAARDAFVDKMFTSPKLKTGCDVLDMQFAHCALRGSESIFKTKNGLMHSPGGGNYYAALWTNDQCEYANPFFAYSGYSAGVEQSKNCYGLYKGYMDKSDIPMENKPALVTSIIACADGFWNGAGDRGDGAMYAYGAARFVLSMGDKAIMEEYFDAIKWCIDFSLSRKNDLGIIKSDSDELENRFESSDANLCTSCLTYDALENGAAIAGILGYDDLRVQWSTEHKKLGDAIERCFGANVSGYNTYRYYIGNKKLRSWICMPLTVEIFDRAPDTVKALFSNKLYVDGMLRTKEGSKTVWDRSLLFALKGVLLCGEAQNGTDALIEYCKNRLLGRHAPYPFEAYPEGNRAHLAAESILFCRAVTEGLFGLKAVGYRQLRIMPALSDTLRDISINNIHFFGKCFDIRCNAQTITIVTDGKQYLSHSSSAVFDFEQRAFL